MDLPSVELVVETLDEGVSDTSSLTDAPRSLMDLDDNFGSSPDSKVSPLRRGFGRLRKSSHLMYDEDEDDFDESEDESAISPSTGRQRRVALMVHISNLEKLPVEVSSCLDIVSLEARLIISSFLKRSQYILPTSTCTACHWLAKCSASSLCPKTLASGGLDFCPYTTFLASKALMISALATSSDGSFFETLLIAAVEVPR
jgi:hypothetical protein